MKKVFEMRRTKKNSKKSEKVYPEPGLFLQKFGINTLNE